MDMSFRTGNLPIGPPKQYRRYYVSNGSLLYYSPIGSPKTRTIYTPPPNSTLTVRFWEITGYTYHGTYYPLIDHETVGIYISVTQNSNGKIVSGSSTTYVSLRNILKS